MPDDPSPPTDAERTALEAYIEEKIDAATAHLRGLSPDELAAVRAVLRAQMSEDPELRELARRAIAQRS